MLVELRIGAGRRAAATLVPPSVHPSGEDVTWDSDGNPTEGPGEELKQQVTLLAAATLLLRHYPAQTKRQTAILVLGGVLARAQWTVEKITSLVGTIARAAGDEEANKRAQSAASAVEHLADGEDKHPGLPRMREVWGEEVAATLFAEWIGYDGNGTPDAPPQGRGRAADNQTNQLIELAEEAELFHSKEGQSYADVWVKDRRETWPLGSKTSGFAQWLRHQFYEATGGAPNTQALTAALNTLSAKARYDGPVREVYVRIAAVEDRIYLHLCDEDWHVIEIDQRGWRVVTDTVRFLWKRGMLPLPIPTEHTPETRRKAIDALFDYVNVATPEDFSLLVSWLLAALRGAGPFPALVLMGEPGAAKSTLARMLKELIDPNKAPLRAPPKEIRDMFVAANNSFLIPFDTPWLV